MIALLELIALGVILLLAAQFLFGVQIFGGRRVSRTPPEAARIDGPPAARAAELLREFENLRSELKGRYPATFAMLGGYLNAHTIGEHGGLEGAVREMVADWAPRRDEIIREITRLLAENEAEDDVRAIIAAACDADLSAEGYRPWLIWLLGRFNSV